MEGAIVLGQRALRAEPSTAGGVVAVQIITRTECHCACPDGWTTRGERDPKGSPRQQTAFITNLPQPIIRPRRAYLSQCVTALVTFPIQSTSLMSLVSQQLSCLEAVVYFTPRHSIPSSRFPNTKHAISVFSTHRVTITQMPLLSRSATWADQSARVIIRTRSPTRGA